MNEDPTFIKQGKEVPTRDSLRETVIVDPFDTTKKLFRSTEKNDKGHYQYYSEGPNGKMKLLHSSAEDGESEKSQLSIGAEAESIWKQENGPR